MSNYEYGYFYYNGTESQTNVAVCDAVLGATIVINKYDIDIEESSRINLPGAKMNLKPADGQTIDLSKIISTNVRLDRTGSGISWETKENESATLGNVPDGKYVCRKSLLRMDIQL